MKPSHFLAGIAFGAATLPASALNVVATPLSAMHPLVGTWTVQVPGRDCHEIYALRADGSKSTRSAQERNEAVFDIAAKPSGKGFYRWADKIVQSNLQPDCSGQVSTIGHVAVTYVRMHPDRQRFLLCSEEELKSCFAEFRRSEESVR